MLQSSKGHQVFSQPSSPNKDSIILETSHAETNMMGYASSLIEPNITNMESQHYAMAASVGPGNLSALGSNHGSTFKKQKYKNITMDQ